MALWSRKQGKSNGNEENKSSVGVTIAGTLMAVFGSSEFIGAIATAQNVQTEAVGIFFLVNGTALVAAQYLLKPILRK